MQWTRRLQRTDVRVCNDKGDIFVETTVASSTTTLDTKNKCVAEDSVVTCIPLLLRGLLVYKKCAVNGWSAGGTARCLPSDCIVSHSGDIYDEERFDTDSW